jgi:CheY-like chemotaxis protein
MDIRLAAGGSGLSAAQQIRRLPGVARSLPIVFCTAFAGEYQSNEEMLLVERSSLLPKPVFRDKLEHILEQALTSH